MQKRVKHLNKIHLPRLSPVMWSLQQGYPRKEIAVPIPDVQSIGMGDDSQNADGRYVATQINPKASPLWSNLYRIGAAGALSRVAPFGPDAFGTDTENGQTESQQSALSGLWPFALAFGGVALITYLGTRDRGHYRGGI